MIFGKKKMEQVFISAGSNLEFPLQQLKLAIQSIQQLPESEFIQHSSIYQTIPLDSIPQADFNNVVIEIKTFLKPEPLLRALLDIETEQGRVRTDQRWGPRIIDLDILLYGSKIIKTKYITIPHYDMKRRSFVIYPLHEIAPDLILPSGEAIADLLKNVSDKGLKIVEHRKPMGAEDGS